MKILIAGGSGLIGRLLIDNWSDKHEITILSRSPDKKRSTLPSHVNIVQWDAKTPQGWGHIVEKIDIILNLTGEPIAGGFRWTKKQKRKILESRVHSGQAITEAIRSVAKKPSLLIQASGINYYGFNTTESDMTTEMTKNGNDFLADVCREWEESTKDVEIMGVRRVILRTTLVLDKQATALKLMTLPYKLFVGGRLSLGGKQWFSWIHHTDFVKAINYFIETKTAKGVYNITSPTPVRYKELNRTIGQTLRRPWFFHVPGFMIHLFLGEKADILLKSVYASPDRLLKEGFEFDFANLKSALNNIYRSK